MPDDPKFEKYLEQRAEQLGLPTDPAAYQDGGLAVAGTARNLPEAEVLATMLKANDIPAWVDSPLSALYAQGYQRPLIAVLVPLGRLADAQRVIAEQAGQPHMEQGTEEPPRRRGWVRLGVSLFLLGLGLFPLAGLVLEIARSTREHDRGPDWLFSIALGALLSFLLVLAGSIGLLGLRKAPRQRGTREP